MRPGDVRKHIIGRKQPRSRRRAETTEDQRIGTGEEVERPPDGDEEDGLPEVGLGDDERRDDQEERYCEHPTRNVGPAGSLGETARR